MAIRNDGVHCPRPYELNVNYQGDMKTVYNFIVALLETACGSTPPVNSEKKVEGVKGCNSLVWAKMFGN